MLIISAIVIQKSCSRRTSFAYYWGVQDEAEVFHSLSKQNHGIFPVASICLNGGVSPPPPTPVGGLVVFLFNCILLALKYCFQLLEVESLSILHVCVTSDWATLSSFSIVSSLIEEVQLIYIECFLCVRPFSKHFTWIIAIFTRDL